MILFHATSWYRAEKILKDAMIKVTNRERTIYSHEGIDRTEMGFTYLATNEQKAARYGRNALRENISNESVATIIEARKWNIEESKQIYVFEIDLPKNDKILFPDEDECKHRVKEKCVSCDIDSCIEKTACLRVKQDLIIGEDVKRYKVLTIPEISNRGELFKVVHDWINL